MSSTDTNCITDLGEDAAPILAAESVAGSRREVWLEPQAYIRQIHTHTHMRSVLVLSFRLLWTLSWEITLNKIRPGESRRHVGIVSGGWGVYLLPPIDTRFNQSSLRALPIQTPPRFKRLSGPRVLGCIIVIISKLRAMVDGIGRGGRSAGGV